MGWPGTHSMLTTKRSSHVVAVVAVRVVDDVAAGLPERLTGLDHPRRLTLELEQHLAFDHVAESGPAGVPVRGRPGVAGGHSMTTVMTSAFCGMNGGVTLSITVNALFGASSRSVIRAWWSSVSRRVRRRAAAVGVQRRTGDEAGPRRRQKQHRSAISVGSAVRPSGGTAEFFVRVAPPAARPRWRSGRVPRC